MNNKIHEICHVIGEITMLAALINSQTDYCVFVDFSGHVDLLNVKINESKKSFNTTLVTGECYVAPNPLWGSKKYNFETLNEIKHQLEKILHEKNIDYSEFKCETREVHMYKMG